MPGNRSEPMSVANRPARPVMIFDGDCGFCRFWIERWRAWTKERVEYIPFQDPAVGQRFPEIPITDCETAVQLVARDGRVYRAAAAVFQSLAGVFLLGWLIGLYRIFPWFAKLTEAAYRFVASRRIYFSRINRWLWGASPELPRYELTTRLLVRATGLIFLTAFISLWVQIHGLVGEEGILPAGDYMRSADAYFDQTGEGMNRYFRLPTLGWIASGDAALHAYCLLGVLGSVLAVWGFAPAAALAGCWLLYLTLVALGQDFLRFQWDILLLEAGLLTALLAPWRWRFQCASLHRPLLGILLVRWLLFRLMLESGVVKWLSGDPTWRELTALQYHFETQPLPHWIAWYAHQLPVWLLKSATVGMFFIELIVPFLIFAPRRLRLFAAVAIAALQGAILATGNYGLFNWLTLVLCLALLDDRAFRALANHLRRWVPRFLTPPPVNRGTSSPRPSPPFEMEERVVPPVRDRERRRFAVLAFKARRIFQAIFPAEPREGAEVPGPSWVDRARGWVLTGYAGVVLLIGAAQLENAFGLRSEGGGPVTALRARLEPFYIVNSYGLFAWMTTVRPELIVEGSLDGSEWRAYRFKYKPDAPERRPPIVPFHMPRLDWQLWFAALRERQPPPWVRNFSQRLFERSPDVLGLLANDPFPDQAPRYLRVMIADYRFTNTSMRKNTGQWWLVFNRRFYLPIMSWENVAPPVPAGR